MAIWPEVPPIPTSRKQNARVFGVAFAGEERRNCMKRLTSIALAAGIILACIELFGCSKMLPPPPKWLVCYEKQAVPRGEWSICQAITHGEKWREDDVDYFRASVQAGNTNIAVVIVSIMKLDD